MSKWLKITLLAIVLLLLLSPLLVLGVAALFNGRVGVETDYGGSPALASPPAPLAEALTLKVVTFNIQDLYFVSGDRPQRMRAIGAALNILDPDIVGFQEAFIAADREILLKELGHTRLVHHHYYPSGTVGSGLLIASAFPIREVYFHRFSAANPFYKIWEGDWWAGKGVALARLELPGGALLDFYNTHAQAGYGNPDYGRVRTEQMAELAQFVNGSRVESAPAFLVGDFNCRPGDGDFETAVRGAGLERVMVGESRIDHIFAVGGSHYTYHVSDTARIERTVSVAGRRFSLSDHPGFMSTVEIRPAE